MRRAVLTLGGTVAGLAALLSFKTHSLAGVSALRGTGTSVAATSTSAPSISVSASVSASVSPSTLGAGASPTITATHADGMGTGSGASRGPSAGAGTGASSSATRIVTGAVATTQHGPMQVQLTLAGQRITKVTVLQQTDDGSESMQIDSTAIPQLTSETLAAQNAHIDAVSGATYTSMGYIQSLQNALDKAGA